MSWMPGNGRCEMTPPSSALPTRTTAHAAHIKPYQGRPPTAPQTGCSSAPTSTGSAGL